MNISKASMVTFAKISLIILTFFMVEQFFATEKNHVRIIGFTILVASLFLKKKYFDDWMVPLSQNVNVRKTIKILFILLLVARAIVAGLKLYKPVKRPEDVAEVYVRASEVLLEKKNPYSEVIDSQNVKEKNGDIKSYNGIKYTPLQMLIYLPVEKLKIKGIVLVNGIVYFLIFFLIFRELFKISAFHAHLGGIFYFGVDYVFTKVFNKGINDYIPTLFMIFSYLSLYKNKDKKAGIFLGLSAAAKQTPAGIFLLIFLAQKRWKAIFFSGVSFLLISLPFFLWSPNDFYKNTIDFMFTRDASGMLYSFLPKNIALTLTVIALGLMCLLAFRKRKETKWIVPTLGLYLFLFSAKVTHGNYWIWVFPFYILYYLTPLQDKEQIKS